MPDRSNRPAFGRKPGFLVACLVAAGALELLGAWPDRPLAAGAVRSVVSRSRLVEVTTGDVSTRGIEFARAGRLLLLLLPDGRLQRLEVATHNAVRPLPNLFHPVNHRHMAAQLRREFGAPFQTIRTAHYVVCHNTSQRLAEQMGELVENLYRRFVSYFSRRAIRLQRPTFPMPVVLFDDREQFSAYVARLDERPALNQIAGFYSLLSNRVLLYNAAGTGRNGLSVPLSRRKNLSTMVHEATHQICYNTGLLQRMAEHPLWLVEGMATYFESPQIRGRRIVWERAGEVNRPRLKRFIAYRRSGRSRDSLESLITSDRRFTSDDSAAEAYAESWALCYFLINTRASQFARYVRRLGTRPPLSTYPAEQRLQDFRNAFGRNLSVLEARFTRYLDEVAKRHLN